jgi:hypothetical protein
VDRNLSTRRCRSCARPRRRIDASARPIWLEIDGGVNLDNIANAAAGGRRYVRGRLGHLLSEDYATTIDSMRAHSRGPGPAACGPAGVTRALPQRATVYASALHAAADAPQTLREAQTGRHIRHVLVLH